MTIPKREQAKFHEFFDISSKRNTEIFSCNGSSNFRQNYSSSRDYASYRLIQDETMISPLPIGILTSADHGKPGDFKPKMFRSFHIFLYSIEADLRLGYFCNLIAQLSKKRAIKQIFGCRIQICYQNCDLRLS